MLNNTTKMYKFSIQVKFLEAYASCFEACASL